MVKVSVSILSADFSNLKKFVDKIPNADSLHMDVMDGHFVPNISFGFPVIKAMRKIWEKEISTHLMISNPSKYISQFAEYSDIITISYECIKFGENIRCEVGVYLNGLAPEDVRVEMLFGRQRKRDKLKEYKRHAFEFIGLTNEQGEHVFALEITPDKCGKLEYQVRAYPRHDLLTHPLETGLMVWL